MGPLERLFGREGCAANNCRFNFGQSEGQRLSGRASFWHVEGPGFKPQHLQQKKSKIC